MIVNPIRTDRIYPGSIDIFSLFDKSIHSVEEKSVLVVTSKIISLCENRVVPIGFLDIDELVKIESDYYLPSAIGKYGYHFTITNNTLISMAGIDESNGGNNYVLWPMDPQKSANEIRKYLIKRFYIKNVGVVITDSTCIAMRRGTMGIAIAYSGFQGLHNYVGSPDLFGRPFKVSQANIAGGLGAAATLVMGEGIEQTPLCIIKDLPFVKFQSRDPSPNELADMNIPLEDDLYAPFLKNVHWQKGSRSQHE